MMEQLNLNQFRRRVVAECFPEFSSLSEALKELHFVQADPIRSPARAQDLILRQRVNGYSAGDLENRFPDLDAEEGYLFAYGIMTREVWRQLRHRPHRKLKKRERAVLEAVADSGETHPRGIRQRFGAKSVRNAWGGQSQETKRILEKLHHHGYLRVSRRENGIRLYQIAEESKGNMAEPASRYRQLGLTTAMVFGPATKRFLVSELRSQNYLLPDRADRLAALDSLVEAGELDQVRVADVTYLWRRRKPSSEEVSERVRILAPFDPLVRDRERFLQLWGWGYRFEAYVAQAKRQRGYYAMPLLWRDKVIGWANASVEDDCLKVNFGYEGNRPRPKTFRSSAEEETEAMAKFLGLRSGAWELTC